MRSEAPNSLPRSFLWIASFLYLGVMFTRLYYSAVGLCSDSPLDALASIGTIGLLLLLEQFAHRQYPSTQPRRDAVLLLVARVVLFEVVAAFDCSGISRALYLIVPFAAYFSLGKKFSIGLAILYMAAFLVRLSLFVPEWYLQEIYVSDLLMFFIGLVFALSMASIASEAETNRKRAEQFLGDLMVSHEKLKSYSEQVAGLAAAEERNRLARDIHDSLGHYLTAINVLLEKAIAFRNRNAKEADLAILDAKRLTREALYDVRQSVGALRLSGEVFSLGTALSKLVKNVDKQNLVVSLEIQGDESSFPKPILVSLYRAAQEGLTNVQKHARAAQVIVRIILNEDEGKLIVVDDGQGFEPSLLGTLSPDRTERFGLQGLRERLELVGGSLKVESYPSKGTHLFVVIPKRPPDSNGQRLVTSSAYG